MAQPRPSGRHRVRQGEHRVGRSGAQGLHHGGGRDPEPMGWQLDLHALVDLFLGQAGQRDGRHVPQHDIVQLPPEVSREVRGRGLTVRVGCQVLHRVVHRRDDLRHRDLAGVTPQSVAAAGPAGAFHQALSAQMAEQLRVSISPKN